MDLDGDGVGEFGTFGEMTAAAGLRAGPSGETRRAPLSSPVLSPALANVDGQGIVTKSGYAFRIFLPGKEGEPVREGRGHGWDWKGAGAGAG